MEAVESSVNQGREPEGAQDLVAMTGKYLTFFLGEQQFGLRIEKIKEILGFLDVTKVPRTAPFVLGVINLRGRVVPIIDLRLRFGMEYRPPDERTAVIVVEATGPEGHQILISLVVDQVNEVLNVGAADVDRRPSLGTQLDTSYILGMAKAEGGVKILLDIDTVISTSKLVA